MALPKLVAKSVPSTAADAVHAELSKFVESYTPGIVNEKPDAVLNFGGHLKKDGLQNTNAFVTDFLDNVGKRLAAEFLKSEDARLERSFLVLYCARNTPKKYTGLGKVTIFLALGPLSCKNGLPKFSKDDPSEGLASGDAFLVGSDTQQLSDRHEGGGFALVSDWTYPDS